MWSWRNSGGRSAEPEPKASDKPSTTPSRVEEGARCRSSSQSDGLSMQPMVSEYAFKSQWWKRLVLRLLEHDRALARGKGVSGITLDDISAWSSQALPPYSRAVESMGTLASFIKALFVQADRNSNRLRELEDRERVYQEEIHMLKQDLAITQLTVHEMQKNKPLRSWIFDDGTDDHDPQAASSGSGAT